MHRSLAIFHIVAAFMWSAICFADVDESIQKLAAQRDKIWPNKTIPVCWQDFAPEHATERDFVRQGVADTWEQVTPVKFVGWGECDDTSQGVRIRIRDDNPAVTALGSELANDDEWVFLNFQFEEWGAELGCLDKWEFCMRVQGVHEFGHVLGLAHEQNRSDTPEQCKDQASGSKPDLYINSWDMYSVMNYCNPVFGLFGSPGDERLSASDIHGAVILYGSNSASALGSDENDDRFASSFAVGDFNNDGIDDLAVGAPGESPWEQPKSGAVFVYQGTARGGLRPASVLTQSELGANEASDQFGASLAAADFNGDGFDDLAVGAPGESVGELARAGFVFLFQGSATGLSPWKGIDQSGLGDNEAGDRFGSSLAAGDIDSDQKADLVVGGVGEAPGSSPQSGYVFVFKGGRTGLEPWIGLDQAGLGENEDGDQFGTDLALGDFDGDGFSDLAVGAPGEDLGSISDSGYVFVYQGSESGLAAWLGLDQSELGSNEAGDLFGSALASGDIDGDGLSDLAIGVPQEIVGQSAQSGHVFVFQGGAGGPEPWLGIDQEGLGTNETGDRFGESIVFGDLDNDGEDDLVVGAPGESPGSDPRSGYVFTFKGDADGLTPWQGLDQHGVGMNEENDFYGASLAIGKFDSLGSYKHIVVGAPQESPFDSPQSGYVFVYGIPEFELLPDPGFYYENSTGVIGVASESDAMMARLRDRLFCPEVDVIGIDDCKDIFSWYAFGQAY